MLTKNIWQMKGLYNGALGTVRGFVFADNTRPPVQPRCILVEFDDYQGPSVIPGINLVPIVTETIAFDGRCGKSVSRQQFPLMLGWAITIHKSQGLTLKQAVLGVGPVERQLGLTNVGSRVKSYEGLAFVKSFPWERLEKINTHAGVRMVRQECERLSSL